VVQQEELRGQLSEALPGATQIAARALGLTTAKLNDLIASGKLFAEDFIPKFSAQLRKEFGKELPASLNEATVALNTFKSSYDQLLQAITDSGIASAAAKNLGALTTVGAHRELTSNSSGITE
jgi:phage tail tape-measure protein